MKIEIISILIFIILITTYARAITPSYNNLKELLGSNPIITEKIYSHNISGEFFTLTTCTYCKYAHKALKNIYNGNNYPFNYISFVYNKNEHASERYGELDIFVTPTVAWDGGFIRDEGAQSIQEAMDKYNSSIVSCGNRSVYDIDLFLDLEWSGAVNNIPYDGEENVSINNFLKWTNSEMMIDFEIYNNEPSQYNGHLHVYVTEINSTFWNDQYGDPYTFAFLDYAFNENITINSGGMLNSIISWDGTNHDDGFGNNYENITQDNIMVIAAVIDENNDYVDETGVYFAGIGTDPKTYDVYFGESNPPPIVASNQSNLTFNPGKLKSETTYYWRIVVWDNNSIPKYGPVWHFKTLKNEPPNTPDIIGPNKGKPGVEYTFCINASDPDNDNLLVSWNWGDGTSTEWGGPYESGTEVWYSHIWNEKGTYTISVTIKDFHGETVTAYKEVIMLRNKLMKNPFLYNFFERFPLLNKILYLFK
ncbi:hypothetical protein AYK24_03570 [Thermoplasmatales archaeon SG8-52-4]|nr:MAG: hypothetical protein AYK24_03570 [Thermoplasmatales archaeon SG8-52-4]